MFKKVNGVKYLGIEGVVVRVDVFINKVSKKIYEKL